MSAPKVFPLSLNGDTFNALKSDFDQILRQLLTEMEEWESEDADITIKVHVKREQDRARDFQANGYDAERDIIKPTFKHEVSSVMQAKNKKSGSLGGNYELVWDRDSKQYVMREIDNGQMSMFDQEEPKGGGAPALPAPENIIDAAYTEIANEGGVEVDAELKKTISVRPVDQNAYDYMKQYVGQEMTVVEVGGEFGVKTSGGKVVVASSFAEDDTFFCPKDALESFGSLAVELVETDHDGKIFLALTCTKDDESHVLFAIYVKEEPNDGVDGENGEDDSADNPDDDYPYDEPEM